MLPVEAENRSQIKTMAHASYFNSDSGLFTSVVKFSNCQFIVLEESDIIDINLFIFLNIVGMY